uniref:Polyprotein n=1 Tax=Latid herpesvirus 1 TaxID=3096545 RepID=A0AB33V6V1_9VIRU
MSLALAIKSSSSPGTSKRSMAALISAAMMLCLHTYMVLIMPFFPLLFQVHALEEVSIGEMRPILMKFYTTVILAHIKMITDMMPQPGTPIIFLPEQNTFFYDNEVLWGILQEAARKNFSGINLMVYKQYNKNGEVEIGRQVSGTKATMVMKLHSAIQNGYIQRLFGVMSFGEAVKGAFLSNRHALRQELCASGERVTGVDAGTFILNPMCMEDFKKLSPLESAEYIFKNLGGMGVSLKDYDPAVISAGSALMTTLGTELMAVTMKSIGTNVKVVTGGKRNNRGTYTRDDLFSAFLLGSTMIGRNPDDGIFTAV